MRAGCRNVQHGRPTDAWANALEPASDVPMTEVTAIPSEVGLNLLELFVGMLMETFITRAIRGSVMFVSMSLLNELLLVMMFAPIFFFCFRFH